MIEFTVCRGRNCPLLVGKEAKETELCADVSNSAAKVAAGE